MPRTNFYHGNWQPKSLEASVFLAVGGLGGRSFCRFLEAGALS
jgi:hypothetical protein